MDSPENRPKFLDYTPVPLSFGTSGLRGLVKDITDLEAYINSLGFLAYLLKTGGALRGDTVVVAGDLRPSTDRIMAAVARAVSDAGLKAENAGKIPTPALTYYAMQSGRPSIMVTGSHIPFDRNGIKFNKKAGEVLKSDEAGILAEVAQARRTEYGRPRQETPFDGSGMLREGQRPRLPEANPEARRMYVRRYLDAFPRGFLKGRRLVLYQHSAVGRDILAEILKELGAEVVAAGRSETFVPIDTENVTEEQLDRLDAMAKEALRAGGLDALVSTDGDSDRPLVAGVAGPEEADARGRRIRFFGGDLLGLLVAEYVKADAAAVPISANDAVDAHLQSLGVRLVKTRIGSPYVIAAMQELEKTGWYSRVVSWEANGGFLTGTDIFLEGRPLKALPTRDALLPILAALHSAFGRTLSLVGNFDRLPKRYSRAGLLDNFPPATSRTILEKFSPSDGGEKEVLFAGGEVSVLDDRGTLRKLGAGAAAAKELLKKKADIESFFTPADGFGPVQRINVIDGVRIFFEGGDVAHVRPSGNAPQLRIYACSSAQARADRIVEDCIAEPGGILRRIEKALK
jgi:phosphomannomutase